MKKKNKVVRVLVRDANGVQTGTREEEAFAFKAFLAIRGHGKQRRYQDLIEDSRARLRQRIEYDLNVDVVVGIIDTRFAAAHAPAGKGMGPGLIPAELFAVAPTEMAKLWDPIIVGSSLDAEVPISFQGGDNCMLDNNPLKSSGLLSNRRDVLLADQEPKMLGGTIRRRLADALVGKIVDSQHGEGLGLGCELAHLGVEAFNAAGSMLKRTVVRVFVDVVQAFASIVAGLHLPLSGREPTNRDMLGTAGFTVAEMDEILKEGKAQEEWDNASVHMRNLVAAMQDFQWAAADFSPGVMQPMIGTSAGVPLAGLVASITLSKVTKSIRRRLAASDQFFCDG